MQCDSRLLGSWTPGVSTAPRRFSGLIGPQLSFRVIAPYSLLGVRWDSGRRANVTSPPDMGLEICTCTCIGAVGWDGVHWHSGHRRDKRRRVVSRSLTDIWRSAAYTSTTSQGTVSFPTRTPSPACRHKTAAVLGRAAQIIMQGDQHVAENPAKTDLYALR